MDGCVGGWMNGWVDMWVDSWIARWVDGYKGGWMDGQIIICVFKTTIQFWSRECFESNRTSAYFSFERAS